METYVALLRGINVGKKRIKMADLVMIFESLGLTAVQTYIQSGNVIFNSELDEETLTELLSCRISLHYGFDVPVILRSSDQFRNALSNCPFTKDEIDNAIALGAVGRYEAVYVSFLPNEITEQDFSKLTKYIEKDNQCAFYGREVYLLLSESIRTAKVAINLKRIGAEGTIRNFNTIKKIGDMLENIEE